jgi:hypothetical protein
MAFINNTITSKGTGSGKDLFVRTGTIADTTTFTQYGDSSAKINLDPTSLDVFDVDLHQDKLVVFSTGQVKWVERVDNSRQITAQPSNIDIKDGTRFQFYNASLNITDKSQIIINKVTPDPIMNDEHGIDLSYGRIRNGALPIHSHDLATKQYVDSLKIGNWNHIEKFEGDGANTEFFVSVPISTYNAIVSVGGVIQDPFDSYIFEFSKNTTKLKFYEAPPEETIITIRTTTSTNLSASTALEEIFVADVDQSVFILQNEVFDKFGLMVTIDGVVQSTMNYDVLTSPAGVRAKTMPNGSVNKVYYGNEYKVLRFAEGLDLGATVRVLNIRGRGFHSHSGTTILLENDSMVPNTAAIVDGTYQQVINGTYLGPDSDVFTTLANNNFTFTVTHDFILNRGGLNLYANTTCDNLYINLPEMGGEYSPDQGMEVKISSSVQTANVFINADPANFMNYEGIFDDPTKSGEGCVYNHQQNVPTVIHLEWESFYRTWYIKYGMGLWNVDPNPIVYPDSEPTP